MYQTTAHLDDSVKSRIMLDVISKYLAKILGTLIESIFHTVCMKCIVLDGLRDGIRCLAGRERPCFAGIYSDTRVSQQIQILLMCEASAPREGVCGDNVIFYQMTDSPWFVHNFCPA